MGIKDKQTYGEYYWAMQVEAQAAFADNAEKAFAPYLAGLLKDIPTIPDMPAGMQNMIDVLSEPPDFAFLPYLIGVGVNAVDELLDVALEPMITILKRAQNRATMEKWLTSAEVNTLLSRKKITEGLWYEVIASEGYEAVLGSALYESQLAYPTIPDIVLYSRYHDDPDNPWSEFQNWYNISPREWPVWNWLGLQRLTTEQAHTAYRRGIFSEEDLSGVLARVGWDAADRPLQKELGWIVPNAMLLVQGDLQQEQSQATILDDITKADIHPKYAQQYLDAVLTKPSSIDIINYGLRKDPSLSGIERRLEQIGIHPDYTPIYKELAYQIPPVADIITMAVREAFSPAIAARFGQYEDFPEPFAEWAAKKGLTKEWAERYWAAHWSLPSPQQGFEMLHRGIINTEELMLLMRALDIMPFWRDKLMRMSYRRLTRVDVRRMYKEGVLDESEVLEAYLQHGYEPENARRMTEFTIRQTLSTMAKFTSADVVSAYTKQMISRSEAGTLLGMLGVRYADQDYILSTADYKRSWALTEQKIKAVHNSYRKAVYDENQTRDQLARLDLPAERIDVLMEQWYYEIKAEEKPTWTTAQTLKFIKTELISRERGIDELRIIGYDTEHINIYLESIK